VFFKRMYIEKRMAREYATACNLILERVFVVFVFALTLLSLRW
jgi:hypothetical protein